MPTDEACFPNCQGKKQSQDLSIGTTLTITDRLGNRALPSATGTGNLIKFYHHDKVELYNLAKDPSETNDLAKKNPDKAKELEGKLVAWQTKMKAKLPVPNPDYAPPSSP